MAIITSQKPNRAAFVGMRHHLLLVPTDLERSRIEPALAEACGGALSLELCGFGPVVAAARTARLIADRRPDRVLLVGIAGRYVERLTIGQAYAFERVACHGIGAGSGPAFTPAAALGWPQWPGDGPDRSTEVADALPCTSGPLPAAAPARAGLLLSACAAASGAADVGERLALHPEAEAEDMEGFAVAAACRLAGVPLDIIRGISNTAGDRDHSRWQIDAACHAAARLAALIIGGRP